MDAARILRTSRLRAGLSQRALAVVTGVAQPAIARMESGAVTPRVDTLDRLLAGCGAGLEAGARLGAGIERSEITRLLAATPDERLAAAENDARALDPRGPAFRPSALLGALAGRGARFVIIGGLAERLLGSPASTGDADVCHARNPGNLRRLAAALADLGSAVPPAALAGPSRTSVPTPAGRLDCVGMPAGSGGYPMLERTAVALPLAGYEVRVASIDDLIQMRRAAGRPGDAIALEILGALRDEIDAAAVRSRKDRPNGR